MYQRLLLILTGFCISGAAMAQLNVMTPTDPCYKYDSTAPKGSRTNPNLPGPNNLVKWVHDSTQNANNRPDPIGSNNFDQTTFKCYFYGNTAFRLRFPVGYDPNSPTRYPLIIFLHGAGEAAYTSQRNNAGANRENQDQLYWGAQLFEQRMNAGEWNGFLLFPQRLAAPNGAGSQWDVTAFPDINNILDTLEKYNRLDPDRVITMGLSAGGVGTFTYASNFPKRIATVVSASPKEIESEIPYIDNFVQIPIWMSAGGIDVGPDPATSLKSRDSIAAHGTNIYLSYYPNSDHNTWTAQWNQRNVKGKFMLSDYWNAASKAQPLVYFQNTELCAGKPISVKMALTPGFAAYEWQMSTGGAFTTIPGATTYTYTATQAGKYQAHYKRNIDSAWSVWSPTPVVVSTKVCSADTAFVEHFDTSPVNQYITFSGSSSGGNSPYRAQNTDCQNGIFPNGSEVFSQDGAGKRGGRFMLNNTAATSSVATCAYFAGDQVWRTYNNVTVTPNTNYIFSFYMGNLSTGFGSDAAATVTQLTPKINGIALSPSGVTATSTGDFSWKKYTYIWNSGNTNSAEIAITNNIATPVGNDFTLDEISLVRYKPFALPIPGAAFKNVNFWSKAGTITAADKDPVEIWQNSDINGDNLVQVDPAILPVFKNNPADNINFNPIVNFTAAKNQFLQVRAGLSGSATHTAVSAYVVAKFDSLSQDYKNLLVEVQSAGKQVSVTLNATGQINWTAGDAGTNTVGTANNAIEAGKPSLWAFSKDNNGTASGGTNKQDIRKDGVVLAASSAAGSFTGNNSTFQIGNGGQQFNGNVAEIVYILDSSITSLTQNRIESYLALKYGTSKGNKTTPLNYTASDSTTIFWTANNKFQVDVFGIGTDSASGLVQTKSNSVNSGSGDGTGQSGKGNLVLQTNTQLLDKQFLMIGNNGNVLTPHVIMPGEANLIAAGSTRITRNWKVQNTGAVGPVVLSFDTTGLGLKSTGGPTVNKYALMINNGGDTSYSTSLTFITASSISNNKIFFNNVTLSNGAVFTVIINNLNVSLPAVWLGFTATAVNSSALLNWKTGDEINVASYSVEHSFNGVSFSAVGSVTANNSTGTNSYSFTQDGLAAGIHYYRIRRIDKDGDSEFSEIKSLKINTTGAIVQVRPNPVIGATLALGVSVQQSSTANIQVMGADGKVIVHQTINLRAGNNSVNVNIATIPPGIYLVQVQLSDEVVTKKFIKER